MNSIILTGANRGLGREIHDILTARKSVLAKYTFISRKLFCEPALGCEYIQSDFGTEEGLNLQINVEPGTENVVLISNAGTIDPIGRAEKITTVEMELSLRINCIAPLALVQQLTLKTKQVGARLYVVNVSSGAAQAPIKGWMPYCTSKAAAVMALNVLAFENDNVLVHHFDPGVMDTDMQSHIRCQLAEIMPDVGLFQDFKNEHALKSPDEVAEVVIKMVGDLLQ